MFIQFSVVRSAPLCAVILRESRGIEPEVTGEIHRLNRLYTGHLIRVVKEGIAAGDIRPKTSPALVRNTVYGNLEHVLWDMLAEKRNPDVDRTAQELTELVFRGIGVEAPPLEGADVAALVQKLNRLLP